MYLGFAMRGHPSSLPVLLSRFESFQIVTFAADKLHGQAGTP
jgi:hypothetical protein